MAFNSLRQECWQPGREELAFLMSAQRTRWREREMWLGHRKAVLVDELAAGAPGEDRIGRGQPLLRLPGWL